MDGCSRRYVLLRGCGWERNMWDTRRRHRQMLGGIAPLYPLVGGMAIDSVWQSVELTVDQVIPALQDE